MDKPAVVVAVAEPSDSEGLGKGEKPKESATGGETAQPWSGHSNENCGGSFCCNANALAACAFKFVELSQRVSRQINFLANFKT